MINAITVNIIKLLLIFSLVIIFTSCKLNDPNIYKYIYIDEIRWSEVERTIDPQERKKLIATLVYSTGLKNIFVGSDGKINREFLNRLEKNIHFIDFNGDGNLDALFEDIPGGHANFSIFIKKSEKKFDDVVSVWGKVKHIEKIKNNWRIMVLNEACCADVIDNLSVYESKFKKGNEIYFYQISNYAFVGFEDYTFLKVNTLNKKFKTKKPITKIRYSALIDDKYEYTAIENTGNIMAEYQENSSGVILYEKRTTSNETWAFVEMINNIKPVTNFYHSGANNLEHFHSLGWINKIDLK